ncbi:MAG: hypothetical protein FWC92_04580 [Defluviitaleaceae bacterium]|nr:hypothetical protein [Defluviitaleaceae bacterium]
MTQFEKQLVKFRGLWNVREPKKKLPDSVLQKMKRKLQFQSESNQIIDDTILWDYLDDAEQQVVNFCNLTNAPRELYHVVINYAIDNLHRDQICCIKP